MFMVRQTQDERRSAAVQRAGRVRRLGTFPTISLNPHEKRSGCPFLPMSWIEKIIIPFGEGDTGAKRGVPETCG